MCIQISEERKRLGGKGGGGKYKCKMWKLKIYLYIKKRGRETQDPTPGREGRAPPARPVPSKCGATGPSEAACGQSGLRCGWRGVVVLGEVATERLLEGLRRELSAQSSRMMGSLVLAGWTGGTGNKGAPRGLSGRADFTFTGRFGRRAARRISRWLSALRRALGKERAAHV